MMQRSWVKLTRSAMQSGAKSVGHALAKAMSSTSTPARKSKAAPRARAVAAPQGDWIAGVALGIGGSAGARRFRLYRPPQLQSGERLPLLVMLHGCGQNANTFAASTRMNQTAQRERFFVLYPEQDRLANVQGCWNWFDTCSGRADREAALIISAIEQVCLLHAVDRERVAVAGLSAGASMAALLVTRSPARFKAVVMHSGIAPGTANSGLSALGAMRGRRAAAPLVPPGVRALGAVTMPRVATAWPPLLVIHGTADAVVSPHNARAAAQVWADAAGARAGVPRAVQRGQRYPMSVTDFKRRGDTVATLVQVGSLAHAWSGGAASQPHSDARGPDASRMVWAFAAKQFRP